MIGPAPVRGNYEKSTGLALFWKMEGRNLYIFNTGRGHAGYRIGKQSHMETNYDGWFKSKRIIVHIFLLKGKT